MIETVSVHKILPDANAIVERLFIGEAFGQDVDYFIVFGNRL